MRGYARGGMGRDVGGASKKGGTRGANWLESSRPYCSVLYSRKHGVRPVEVGRKDELELVALEGRAWK